MRHLRFSRFSLDQPVNITVADQMLVSCCNFAFGVLLARSIGITEFGRFSLAWLAVDLLGSLQSALVIQPMLNIGPKQAADDMAAYFGALTVQEGVVALASGVLVWLVSMAAGWGLGLGGIAGLGLPLALTVVAVQSHDYVRRYFFARGRVKAALLIDIVRFVLQLGGIVALAHLLHGSAVHGLWVVAVACAIGSAVGAALLDKLEWKVEVFREVLWRHWRFSRWLLPSTVMNIAMVQVYPLAAGSLLGVAVVGLLNIGKTALGFITVLLLALNNFAPVQASRTLHLAGRAALRRYMGRLGLATMLIASVIVTAILLFPDLLIRVFYGPSFMEAATAVRWFAVVYLIYSASMVLIIWASANEMTKTIFYSYVAAAAVALLGTFPLARFMGLSGIYLCMLATEIVRFLILAALLFLEDADARRQEARQRSALWSAEPVRVEIPEL